MTVFQAGKLPPEILGRLVMGGKRRDPRVLIGPKIGEDAAAIDYGDKILVAKTDPITFATQRIGWYAANINANDIATMGATPKWFLSTVLLPEGISEREIEAIFADLHAALDELDVTVCGGHTEVCQGLDRPILVGQMLGEVDKGRLVDNSRLAEGDDLLLTKGIAIEATALIAMEKEEELREKFSDHFITQAKAFLDHPGLSVVRDALLANQITHCKAMHDPTEGGLATGLRELAHVAEVGLHILGDNINMYEEAEVLCAEYDLDPLGAIASGALIIGVTPEDTDRVQEILREAGSECFVIGQAREAAYGIKIQRDGVLEDLPSFERDEIIKIFAEEDWEEDA